VPSRGAMSHDAHLLVDEHSRDEQRALPKAPRPIERRTEKSRSVGSTSAGGRRVHRPPIQWPTS
jgi:hypothetical protein